MLRNAFSQEIGPCSLQLSTVLCNSIKDCLKLEISINNYPPILFAWNDENTCIVLPRLYSRSIYTRYSASQVVAHRRGIGITDVLVKRVILLESDCGRDRSLGA